MSVIEVDKLNGSAVKILENCQNLLFSLEDNGNGETFLATQLRESINALVEAGVRTKDMQPTQEEIAGVMAAFKNAKRKEAAGVEDEDDEVFWQELELNEKLWHLDDLKKIAMSVIEKSKLESNAPDMLEICQDLLDWLDWNGKGTIPIAEKLRLFIWSLLEAGVRPDIVETNKRAELQEAKNVKIDHVKFWQQLDDIIANYEPVSKNGKA